ncbi:hypothetical protein NDU88_002532 [Pleurodeles waltl]|uniref:Uncharacterized protein n=1 Tax=Pleurodeles waltl TaxID=8319 RepID=A0AAV7RAJ2_PLEWA|nr:hypothetical protein NDU88_002532 [Pleurodeles waltl]
MLSEEITAATRTLWKSKRIKSTLLEVPPRHEREKGRNKSTLGDAPGAQKAIKRHPQGTSGHPFLEPGDPCGRATEKETLAGPAVDGEGFPWARPPCGLRKSRPRHTPK